MLIMKREVIDIWCDEMLSKMSRWDWDQDKIVIERVGGISGIGEEEMHSLIHELMYVNIPIHLDDQKLCNIILEARENSLTLPEYMKVTKGYKISLGEILILFAAFASMNYGGTELFWLDILLNNSIFSPLPKDYVELSRTIINVYNNDISIFRDTPNLKSLYNQFDFQMIRFFDQRKVKDIVFDLTKFRDLFKKSTYMED